MVCRPDHKSVNADGEQVLEDAVAKLRLAYAAAVKARIWGSLTLNLVLEDGFLATADVQERRTTLVKKRGKS